MIFLEKLHHLTLRFGHIETLLEPQKYYEPTLQKNFELTTLAILFFRIEFVQYCSKTSGEKENRLYFFSLLAH
jgi:hypothetical protein